MNRNLKSRKDSSRNIRPHSDYQQLPLLRLIQMISVIAIPVALQNLLTTTGSMVDTIMLASLGERTVGAAGLCAQYSSLMFSGYWGFVGGGMLFFSQFYGSGEHENIRKSYGMTIVFMMISGVTLPSRKSESDTFRLSALHTRCRFSPWLRAPFCAQSVR